MNLKELEIRPTVQKIYDLLGQERIMSFYFNDNVVMGKSYLNPFRDDSNPSCKFYWTKKGNLYFCDFATEQVVYSPIDVACMRTGYTFPDILYKIEADFHLTSLNLEDKKQLEEETKLFKVPEIKPATIKVRVTKFKKSDLDYWAQFGITEDILKFYNIRRVDKAWISNTLWYVNTDNDPCYRYKEKDRFKLYRPFSKPATKWRTNFFGGILEGYTQLPHRGQTLIITKGLKDVMTFQSLGVNATAVRSENTPVSENAFNLLKNRFENIYVWFDADEAGIIGANKIAKKYGIPSINHDKKLGKDPSEILKNHGKEKLIELIKLYTK
jgi:hypothetical protein